MSKMSTVYHQQDFQFNMYPLCVCARAIVRQCVNRRVQFVCASATFAPGQVDVIEDLLCDCDDKSVPIDDTLGSIEVNPFGGRELHHVFLCSSFLNAKDMEIAVLRQHLFFQYLVCDTEDHAEFFSSKLSAVFHVLAVVPARQAIVFCNSTFQGHQISAHLNSVGLASVYTSGKSSQGERLANLESVKKEFSKVVVCSDVYARGVDLKCVDLVINFDLPIDRDVFLHRCGRAGRFGKPGVCVCVALRSEVMQVQYFAIQLGISIPDFDTFGADYMQAASAQLPSGGGVTALRSTEGTELTDECIVDDGPSVDGTQAATGSDRAHSARGGPQKKRVKLNRDCLSQDQEVVVDHAIEEDFVKEFPSQSYFSNIIDDAFGDMSDERRSLCLSTLPNTLRQAMRGRLRSSVWTTRDCCT
eukprot:Lankesteria_metandrocarpae@DN4771_c0_g1_i4.p1